LAKFELFQWLDDFLIRLCEGFDWDSGNSGKSFRKHSISDAEIEEVFRDKELLILGKQISPETNEPRFGVIGKASEGRIIFISFTIRELKIRPISARLGEKKIRKLYE
jgi:uncharacterized protein